MASPTPTNILIFTNGNLFARVILDKFLNKYKSRISMVVIVSGDYFGNKGFKALFEFSRLTSWIYVFYKIWTIIMIKLLRVFDKSIVSSVEQLCNSLSVPVCFVSDINETPLYEKIKALSPEYLVSVSCPQLIRQKWLNLVEGRGINIHSSLLPKFGGLAPYFWVLANGENETGISVHYLIKGFDKGNILCQAKIAIEKRISCFRLFLKLCIEGQSILMAAFYKLENRNKGIEQDLLKFTYYSHPTSTSYFNLKRKGYSLYNFSDFKFTRTYIKKLTFDDSIHIEK